MSPAWTSMQSGVSTQCTGADVTGGGGPVGARDAPSGWGTAGGQRTLAPLDAGDGGPNVEAGPEDAGDAQDDTPPSQF